MSALRAAFDQERAWVRDCDDQHALLDRMAGYRDNMAYARQVGNAQAHAFAEHLVELAEDRLTALKVGATRVKERPAPPPPRVEAPQPPPEPPARPASAPPRVDDSAVVRQLQEALATSQEAERRAARDRDAAERRAREASAVRDSLVASQKREQGRVSMAPAASQARRIVRDAERLPPPATAPTARTANAPRTRTATAPSPRNPLAGTPPPHAREPDSARGRAPAAPSKPTASRDDDAGYAEADRLALASVGHWPPTPTGHRGAFWAKHDDWPRDWTLTGGDLGRFRGQVNLTRAVFAAQLGVPSAVVKDAEMSPRERVGPALQIALRRAMDHEAEVGRRRREERAAVAAVVASPEPVTAVEVPAATTAAPATEVGTDAPASAPTPFTGADLARFRSERRLSQREMADLLGVEQGTISKGEGKAGAALGPALQAAMTRLGTGGGPAIPE